MVSIMGRGVEEYWEEPMMDGSVEVVGWLRVMMVVIGRVLGLQRW